MKEFFSENQIQHQIHAILDILELNIIGEKLSRSGTYEVLPCRSTAGKKFIIKVRRRNTSETARAFQNERQIMKYLSEHADGSLHGPNQVYIFENTLPEGLVYSFIEGEPLGWYFFDAYPKKIADVGATAIVQALFFLQNSTSKLQAFTHLEIITTIFLLSAMQTQSNHALRGGLPVTLYEKMHSIVKETASTWLLNPVIVHGDFNPKNIVLPTDHTLSFIDWSDIRLGSQYYDLAFLWLCCWRSPHIQESIVKQLSNSTEFWQTLCFWIPKYYAILYDTEQALQVELASQEISKKRYVEIMQLVSEAKAYYNNRLEDIINLAS